MEVGATGSGALAWPSARQPLIRSAAEEGRFAVSLGNAVAARKEAAAGTTASATPFADAIGKAAGNATGAGAGSAAADRTSGTTAGVPSKGGTVDAPAATATAGTAGTAQSTDTAAGTEDRFLKLLVAQMRNQDPLNPMDNAQVTTQLAQINTVRGIEELNAKVGDLLKSGQQGEMLGSVGMMGRQVIVPGDRFDYKPGAAGQPARFGFDPGSPASTATVELLDPAGKVVMTRELRDVAAGTQILEWDGRGADGRAVAAGAMTVRVTAFQGNTPLTATPLVPARVVGLSQTAGGTQVQLEGGAKASSQDVRMVL